METAVAQKILENTPCCTPANTGTPANDVGCYIINDNNSPLKIFITLEDKIINGVTYKSFFNCTNNGCYFNFTIYNSINDVYTKYHLSYHRSVNNNAGQLVRHRIHIKYRNGYPGHPSWNLMSNDTFNVGATGDHGTRILGQNMNEQFDLQLNSDNNNNATIGPHPQQSPNIVNLQPMNQVMGLFNCFIPMTLKCILALDSIGNYMEF